MWTGGLQDGGSQSGVYLLVVSVGLYYNGIAFRQRFEGLCI